MCCSLRQCRSDSFSCPEVLPCVCEQAYVSASMCTFRYANQLSCSSSDTIPCLLDMLLQGRTTLLVGPPGAGKSVLLQLLAGHFKNTAFCRITGDIKYNGKDKKDFVIQRTAGLVDQYDEHIANLTVHETLDFATACQVGKKKVDQDHILKVSHRSCHFRHPSWFDCISCVSGAQTGIKQ